MIYTYFGQVKLPMGNVEYDQQEEAHEAIFELPGGGFFDYYQDSVAPTKLQRIGIVGVLVACSHQELMEKVRNLRAMLGKKDELKRKISKYNEICFARMQGFQANTIKSTQQRHLGINCLFVRLTDWKPAH